MLETDLERVLVENDDGVFVAHGNIYIDVNSFINRFDGAMFDHEDLINHDKTTPAWKLIFDDWKDQGVLS